MSGSMVMPADDERPALAKKWDLKVLVGSGDRIGLLVLPFLVVGVALNILRPALFEVGGPSMALRVVSAAVLVPGITGWLWSVVLILARVPRGELITGGPFKLVKHPLYTCVALLVLPWVGFLLNTWLGALIGAVLYLGSRIFAPAEERKLAEAFGTAWNEYADRVAIPWL
jgi:protein-S-isoprenylcysteine O-methyltransferase Ste14